MHDTATDLVVGALTKVLQPHAPTGGAADLVVTARSERPGTAGDLGAGPPECPATIHSRFDPAKRACLTMLER